MSSTNKRCPYCGSLEERKQRVFSTRDAKDPDAIFVDTVYCCGCGEVKDFKN